ncbi:hypothetical protein AaE_004291, partial [Aphanomyces astaci]
MPLKAYMTESYPWSLRLAILPMGDNVSHDTYEPQIYAFLSAQYNNATVSPSTTFSRDHVKNTYLLRFALSLPTHGDSSTPCWSWLARFPDNVAAIFYSLEKRQFVCDFVAANASSRLSMKLHHCQKNRLFGVTPDEASPVNIPDSTYYTVYHSGQVWGGRAMCWVKFTWRCALGVYILWLMWRVYYRHYGPLVRNLRAIGLDKQCHTYPVKDHPIVVVGMTVDCIVGAAYLGVATIRVTQVTDVTEFAVGCLYGSRTVWAAYLTMRFITPLVKRHCWERHFEPLDPGVMALTASLYAGPLVFIVCNSPLLLLFQPLLTVFLPPEHHYDAVDSELVTIGLLMLLASVPIVRSVWIPKLLRQCSIKQGGATTLRNDVASSQFNDLKQRILFGLLRRPCSVDQVGGSLHSLLDECCRVQRLPLFSPRGADCFVTCVPPTTNDTT